jgi:hypothetical protein
MDKKEKQLLHLTQMIVEHYWQKDLKPLLENIHPDIFLIGPMERDYIHGRKAFVAAMQRNQSEMPVVQLDDEHYEAVVVMPDLCVVACRYRCFTTPDSGLVLSERQRGTYVWVREGDHFLIRHLHVSSTLHIQDDDENFPIRAGRETYLYMENLIDRKSVMKPINVRDSNGIVYVLDPDDILAVTADRNYTIITRADEQKDVRCRMSFTAMMEALPPIFLRVSRSMAVNIHYIDHLERTQICLVNRACYPIPQRRYNEIRERLDRMNRQGL